MAALAVDLVEIVTMRLPMAVRVHASSDAASGVREMLAVRVRSAAGVDGHAYAYTRGLPLGQIVTQLAERFVGHTVTGIDSALAQDVRRASAAVWPTLARGVGLLDIAAADMYCQAEGRAVHQVLGWEEAPTPLAIPVLGYDTKDRGELIDEVGGWGARGHRLTKLHLLGSELETELSLALALLDEFSPETVGFDFHYRFDRSEDAVGPCSRLHEAGAAFIEDPLPYWDHPGLCDLVGRSDARVAIGEDIAAEAGWELAADVAQVLRVDATVCGGIATSLRGARVTAERGRSLFPHVHAGLHARLFGHQQVTIGVEFIPSSQGVDPIDDFLVTGDVVKDGHMVVSEMPTVGMRLDWDRVVAQASERRSVGGSRG